MREKKGGQQREGGVEQRGKGGLESWGGRLRPLATCSIGDAFLRGLLSFRTQFPHLGNGWWKAPPSSRSCRRERRREGSQEPGATFFPIRLCSPASQSAGRGGARAAKAGALPALARRELTRS